MFAGVNFSSRLKAGLQFADLLGTYLPSGLATLTTTSIAFDRRTPYIAGPARWVDCLVIVKALHADKY